MTTPEWDGRKRVVIEGVQPEINGGRFPIKRIIGDMVRVEADIFTDGHDAISAAVLFRPENSDDWIERPMRPLFNDRWWGEFPVSALGRYRYTVRAWIDHFETWQRDLRKRIQANQDTDVDYWIGADLIADASKRASDPDAAWLNNQSRILRESENLEEKRTAATAEALALAVAKVSDYPLATEYDRELVIVVDPIRARFSSWYEMFPRSTSPTPERHGTLSDCTARLDYVAQMGFNVVYLPPIHPIGFTFRKGRNNSPTAEADDTGSPWAIGSMAGGHKSIHPDLGTIEDFDRLVARASSLGIQIALDIAFQASPDHPYVREHAEWFRKRPDGTIQYAENPPKKYQDIYPFDFETPQWFELWQELKSVFTFWIDHGVRIFRVDNPHTKAFPFWEWVINDIKQDAPDVLFLAEAFTRPKIMYQLAKLGFSQSYTYFPWRNSKRELTEYLSELTKTEVREYFRANQWPNTPDILTEFLQTGGRPAFMMRLLLAATLGANYGIYGPAFELLEGRAVQYGSEEYLDSEKYQIRHWNLDSPESLRELIALVNLIRRETPALHNDWSLEFHSVDNEQLICYSKQTEDGADLVVIVVNLDPHYTQSGYVNLPLDRLGIDTTRPFQAHDLLTGSRYFWSGPRNYVELNPHKIPAHIFRIRHRLRSETDFEYFL